jgi:ABC-type transport system involved in multi-copper enzyme maturation permease subunit
MTRRPPWRTIALWHFRDLLRARTGLAVLAMWGLLLAVALWAGLTAARADRIQADSQQHATRQAFATWLALYDADDWRPVYMTAENPLLLQVPPAPGRFFAAGVRDLGGSWVLPIGYHLRELEGRQADLSPVGSLLGGFDLTGLIALAGALAALALGQDAVTGERERGTLALHLAAPLPANTLIQGKLMGTAAAISLGLALPTAVALAIGALATGRAAWGPALVTAVAAWVYLLGWGAVAVAVSGRVHRSSTAMMTLVGGWIVVAVLWPRLALLIADRQVPLPAPASLHQALQRDLDEAKAWYRKAYDDRTARSNQALTSRDIASLKLAYLDRTEALMQATRNRQTTAIAAHARTFDQWAMLSPTAAFTALANRVAGTGIETHRGFLQSANAYLQHLKRWSEQRVLAGQLGPPAWADLPALPASPAPGLPLRHGGVLLLPLLMVWLSIAGRRPLPLHR